MEEIKINSEQEASKKNSNLVKPLEEAKKVSDLKMSRKLIIIFIVLILLGIVSGYGIYAVKNKGALPLTGKQVQTVKTATEEGVTDAATFKDTATGQIVDNDGKITKEGTHILIRGDVSQNVYLTSSVIDLSKYVGKKVQIWGETFQGQKAGWLMDVGRIKVL